MKTILSAKTLIVLMVFLSSFVGYDLGLLKGKLDTHLGFSGAIRLLHQMSDAHSEPRMNAALQVYLEEEANALEAILESVIGHMIFELYLDEVSERDILSYINKYKTNTK